MKPFGAATTSDDEDSGSDDCEDGSENDGEEQEEEKIKFHEKHERKCLIVTTLKDDANPS